MSTVIEVDHVTKEFTLGQLSGMGRGLRNGVCRLLGRPVEQVAPFKALSDVSFSVRQGEVLGVIGHNGAGKSTLLKLLAGISRPSRGRLNVQGRIAPLIEVGAGLVPDMTGRENIYLNGAILGMRHEEIRRKFDDIVAFAEMDKFIDTPVKRYSSGMQVRLGFAIATAVDAGVLIVDEVLAVGDLAFQRKCYDRIEGFVRSGDRTLLLVSHNLRQIERLCTRAILLNKGRLTVDGDPKLVCDAFLTESNSRIAADRATASRRIESSGDIELISVQTDLGFDTFGAPARLKVSVSVDVKAALQDVVFTIGIHTTDIFVISAVSSELAVPELTLTPGRHSLDCVFDDLRLTAGVYAVYVGVEAGVIAAPIFRADSVTTFQVDQPLGSTGSASDRYGVVRCRANWRLQARTSIGADVLATECTPDTEIP